MCIRDSFGAARTAGDWSNEELLGRRVDVDGSGSIDLLTEVCWGHSVTAAKRDAAQLLQSSLLAEAFDAFVEGRQFIADRRGGLTNAELDELVAIRDRALDAWELALVTTVIHYMNESLVDLDTLGTQDYDFARQAKHWSEMKGYGLGLQFSPCLLYTSDAADE